MFSVSSKVSLASCSNTSSSKIKVKPSIPILVRLISTQCHPGKKTPVFLMFSGRCQEMLLFFSHGNTRIGVQRVSLENKTQFILSSVNLKGLAKVMIIRSNHTFTYKTQRCTRQVITFAMGLAPSLFQATSKAVFGWWRSSFGILQVLPETFSCVGHPGKRPLSGPALSDRTTVLLCSR